MQDETAAIAYKRLVLVVILRNPVEVARAVIPHRRHSLRMIPWAGEAFQEAGVSIRNPFFFFQE